MIRIRFFGSGELIRERSGPHGIPIQAWHTLKTDPVYRDRAERRTNKRWTSTQKKWNELITRRASLEPSIVLGPPTEEKEGEDQPSVRDAKRARGGPEQDLPDEIPIASADDTFTTPEILVLPSDAISPSSTPIPISSGASSSSGVKRTYSESTALPNSPGVSSVSGESIVNDDEEQPGTRALISALTSGDGITDEWLSSRYPRQI